MVSSGKQDIYLTVRPEITFFKKVFRRHTTFATELIRLPPQQSPEYNNIITFILNIGDCINRCYMEIELPNLAFSDSYIITDASYIRGQNASLGYSLSDKFTKRIGLQKVRIYISAQNFFLRTKAEGYDPEGSSLDKNLSLAPNSDKYQYPTPSIYAFGLNVSL